MSEVHTVTTALNPGFFWLKRMTQRLNRESWVWDRLTHANVLPFLGISNDAGDEGSSPAFVSPLCANGHITDYLKINPEADRLKMVGHFKRVLGSPRFIYTGRRCRERVVLFAFNESNSW